MQYVVQSPRKPYEDVLLEVYGTSWQSTMWASKMCLNGIRSVSSITSELGTIEDHGPITNEMVTLFNL